MIGTRLAAIVLAMTDDGMLADFAGAVFTGALVICHESDSSVVVVKAKLSSLTLFSDRRFPISGAGIFQYMDSKPPEVNDGSHLLKNNSGVLSHP
jgi:hypothetical protein